MKVLIDIGNTRLKRALWDGCALSDSRAVAHDGGSGAMDFDALWKDIEGIESAWIASVATLQLGTRIAAGLRERFACPVTFVRSQARACGVTSAYANPQNLGVDRFLGLIGVHALEKRAAVVVGCGTALTLDAISVDGTHLGGLIAPGLRLMRESLREGTARLGESQSARVVEIANNTADAIESGIHWATVAAIERFVSSATARLGEEPLLVLSGGDAARVGAALVMPHRIEADIVLRGLAEFSDSATSRE